MTFGQEHPNHSPSVPPSAVDVPLPHHGLTGWAALILAAGAAVLVTPMLLGHREPDQRQSTPLVAPSRAAGHSVGPGPEVGASGFERFVQLDEVLLRSTDDDADPPEMPSAEKVFERSAALSAIRTVGACLTECGPNAVGSMNVVVTFAPSGETMRAELEDGALQGTPEGSCVVRHLRDARVPSFDGEQETVRTALVLGQ